MKLDRFKDFNATGIATDGRLYAGDLNLFQDLVAASVDLAQDLEVNSITVGEAGLTISRFGAGQFGMAGALRLSGILTAIGGYVQASYTTTARDALVNPPALLLIYNSTTAQFEYNSGSPGVPVWSTIVPVLGTGSVTTAMLADGAVTTVKLADKSVTAAKLADALRPSQSATPGTEAIRALGSGANEAAAGNDARLSDARSPTGHHARHEPGGTDALDLTTIHLKGALTAMVNALAISHPGALYYANDDRGGATYRSNGATWEQVAAPVQYGAVVATTLVGLGTAWDGKVGLLRTGSSPYNFLTVIYDATYGKWVSAQTVSYGTETSGFNSTTRNNTGYTIYVDVGGNNVWQPWRPFDTAGLKPQARVGARFTASGGTASMRPAYIGGDDGGADQAFVTVSGSEITTTTTTDPNPNWTQAPFAQIDAGYTVADKIRFGIAGKISTGAQTWRYAVVQVDVRWVG